MQYLGGKSKIARWLVAAIRPRLAGREFWDAFCGGLSVSLALSETGARGLATDANPALIALYQAVAEGWDPPAVVTEDEYRAAKALPDSDPRKAFAGFACSFGGKWFGGYARAPKQEGRTYAGAGRTALLRDVGALTERGVPIALANFLEVEPDPSFAGVLYLDPPYADTTGYNATGPFDHGRFYRRVEAWARCTDVFVSEYAMPAELGGRLVMEFSHDMSVAGGVRKAARVERLYHYDPDTVGRAPCTHRALTRGLGPRQACPACNRTAPAGVLVA